MRYFLTLFASFTCTLALAQTGTIRGTVFAQSSGETLIGVNILVKGTDQGTITDLDGQFTLQLAPGVYELQISYITYQTTTISAIEVKSGEVTLLENVRMLDSNLELGEVIITAEAVRTSETAILSMKKKSAAIMDGISASKMRLTGDATAIEAAKRVTGVSIEGGKYIYVRGLGDRYTKTTLNGVDIPGLDPDRNSLQMDIFPTNLIDNIVVRKNFTADLPADFTGGLVNVETKAFPERKILSASFSTSYNPRMHLNKDYLTYDGGKTDFLGFDDGTRELPNGATSRTIPSPVNGSNPQDVNRFVNSFDPELGAKRATSPVDYNASFTIGDQIDLKPSKDSLSQTTTNGNKLGYIFSLSYRAEYRYYDDLMYGEYQRFSDPNINEMRYATTQDGELGEHSVLIGALGGLAYKTQRSKYRLTLLRLQNGESRAGKFQIDNDGEAVGQSGYFAASDNLEYNQRSLTNVLLNGTHSLENSKWEIDWRAATTLSTSDDPDIRRTAFTQTNVDTLFIAGAGGNPARIWRDLSEISATGKVDIERSYKANGQNAKLKLGASHVYKQRDYEILFFDMQFSSLQDWPIPEASEVLNPDNIFPNSPNGIFYNSGNSFPNANEYSSNIQNTAFYASNEMVFFEKLKTILGLRAENYVQRHTGRDQAFASGDPNGQNLVNDKVLESFHLFPSVNLIYGFTENQNLRFSYTRTIARPSFKELSFAQIIDPITNRIFNGSLFRYSDWNGELVETLVNNLDLRWELFQERGQLFSISGFYKQFADPIELVRIPEQQTSTEFQPRNVGDGQLFGVEIEIRKDLEFISPNLTAFSLNGNVTFVESIIDITDTEFNARNNFERTGETITDTRQMAGQAPYVVNLGLGYSNTEKAVEVGLFYNVKGSTLFIVGSGLYPDIYTEPFHSLNFSLNKRFGEDDRTSLDFRVSNILNDKMETVYRSYEADDQPFTVFTPGPSFTVGVSHKFN